MTTTYPPAEEGKQELITLEEISNLTYFLEKESSLKRKTVKLVLLLLDEFSIIPIDGNLLRLAAHNYHKDFEADILGQAAEKHNLDCIVTRDVKGFRKSKVPAYNPAQFLEMVLDK